MTGFTALQDVTVSQQPEDNLEILFSHGLTVFYSWTYRDNYCHINCFWRILMPGPGKGVSNDLMPLKMKRLSNG